MPPSVGIHVDGSSEWPAPTLLAVHRGRLAGAGRSKTEIEISMARAVGCFLPALPALPPPCIVMSFRAASYRPVAVIGPLGAQLAEEAAVAVRHLRGRRDTRDALAGT